MMRLSLNSIHTPPVVPGIIFLFIAVSPPSSFMRLMANGCCGMKTSRAWTWSNTNAELPKRIKKLGLKDTIEITLINKLK